MLDQFTFSKSLIFSMFLAKKGLLEHINKQTKALLDEYDKYRFLSIPIIFNYTDDNLSILNKVKKTFFDERIALFIFDIEKHLDDNMFSALLNESISTTESNNDDIIDMLNSMVESEGVIFPDFSNTIYSFKTEDHDLTASILSILFELEIDSVNKIIFVDKTYPNNIYIKKLDDIINIDFKTENLHKFKSIKIKSSFDDIIINFLSLIWVKADDFRYNFLKEIAQNKTTNLIAELKNNNKLEVINILQSLSLKKINIVEVYFSRAFPNEEEVKIKKLSIKLSIDELQERFPNYSKKELLNYRLVYINDVLQTIENSEYIDFKSKIFLKSARRVSEFFSDTELDYSAVIIGYSKFFESEISLSIVQLIRKYLNITIPKYYYKYYPYKGNYFVYGDKNFAVNFNKKDFESGKYIPPGLGQSLISLKILNLNKVNYKDKIIELGLEISKIRNKTAHPEMVNYSDMQKIKEYLVKIYSYGILSELKSIKDYLISGSN